VGVCVSGKSRLSGEERGELFELVSVEDDVGACGRTVGMECCLGSDLCGKAYADEAVAVKDEVIRENERLTL